MISADSKKRAACAANRIISTAPTEKLAAISTRTEGAPASQSRTWASRASSNPDVPTTVSSPWLMHQCRLSRTAPGWVKSTTTAQPARSSRGSPASTAAPTSRSSAADTAARTAVPIRPRAPSTPTLIIASRFPESLAPPG